MMSTANFTQERAPLPAKAWDRSANVMHCSSFSKSLVAVSHRLGCRGSARPANSKLQLMSTLTTSVPIQLALANYLTTRNYEQHLRQLRRKLHERKRRCWSSFIRRFRPK